MSLVPAEQEADIYPYEEVAKGAKNQTYKKQLQDIHSVLDSIPNNKRRRLYLVDASQGQYLENVSSKGFSAVWIKAANSHVMIHSATLSATLANNHWYESDNGTVTDKADTTNNGDMILYQG